MDASSKFSQLMSEETISSTLRDRFNCILQNEDTVIEKSKDGKLNWYFQWERNDSWSPSTITENTPTVYTSSIPDDNMSREGISPPKLHNQRQIHFIPSLLSSQQVQSLLNIVTFQIQQQRQGSNPKTKCAVVIEDGERKWNTKQHPNQCLATVLEPIIQKQILPLVRSIYHAPNMVVADSIIRWYIADEQDDGSNENLPPHYDLTAYASMIIPLNPEECQGGLYVQSGASSDSRLTVDFNHYQDVAVSQSHSNQKHNGILQRGDAILHQYDVMHGVELRGGTRYSLVLWMVLDEESMMNRTAPWVEKDALKHESVHAAFLYGMYAQNGLHGVPEDLILAKQYWEWASERGHALSQYMLSMLLIKIGYDGDSKPSPSKVEWSNRIMSLLRESADRGLDLSQHALAQTYRWGYHGVSKDEFLARKYYIAAAKQGHTKSIEALLEKII